MDINFRYKKGVFLLITLAMIFVAAAFMLMQEREGARTTMSYPQAKAGLKLNPNVIAMVPIPLHKPDVNGLEKARYGVFKGLRNLIGLEEAVDELEEKNLVINNWHRADLEQSKKKVTPVARAITKSVQNKIKQGQPVQALVYFRNDSARKGMSVSEHDSVQSKIAAGFLYSGKIESAGKLAVQSAERSGGEVPLAGWIAGLSLWQQEKYNEAAKYFEIAASSNNSSLWMASAASFWASRAYEKAGNNRAMMISLKQAARYSRTFYGLMAIQTLGQSFDFNWDAPTFDDGREAVLKSSAAGARAVALVEKGSYVQAEQELLRIADTQDSDLRDALLSYADHVNLPKLSMRLGNKMLQTEGQYMDAALYPVGPWTPEEGFTVDSALVHAVMRQESKFDTSARSSRGAMGLMQIMPSTAQYVARSKSYGHAVDLNSPKMNLKVGQDYLKYLLKDKAVNGDILKLLVAYNAGPGNLAKWSTAIGEDTDPLLFIEMIPVSETRDYVEHVMASYWMYRLRDGRDVPSLRAVSRGEPAQYAQATLDEGAYRLAMLGR